MMTERKTAPSTLFSGLSAFPLTPIGGDGHLQEEVLCRFLMRIHAAGADSIGLLGSTGGYAYLTREQRQRIVRVAMACVGSRTPIIVGVGALRTDEAQALARSAREAGADGLLLAPMSYVPLTDEEVFQHYAAVAEAGELPLCVYNNPKATHFVFSDSLLARLAGLPNVAAVKMPFPADGDVAGEMTRLRAMVPDDFGIGYSGDWGAADALLSGAAAWYSVVAGLLPVPALALTRAAQAGDRAETVRINEAFQPLWDLFKTFGGFRVMYVMADLLGLGRFEPPRPVLPLPREVRVRVEAAVLAVESVDGFGPYERDPVAR